MNEREFDDIFKDRIGDELPFDFRPSDWEAAAQELDKVLPVMSAPAVAPNPVIQPAAKILGFSKWAAAAAVVVMASQGWLLAKLFDVSHELKALKEQNSVAIATPQEATNTTKSAETIVIRDTIVKTVYIEVPTSQKANKSNILKSNQLDTPQNGTWTVENKKQNLNTTTENSTPNALNNTNKNNRPTEVINDKQNIIAQSDVTGKNNSQPLINTANPEKKPENNNSVIAQNNSTLDKTITPNTTNATAAENKESIALGSLYHLPTVKLHTVSPLHKDALWMNTEDLKLIYNSGGKSIIKPLPMENGWKIGVNAVAILTELPKNGGTKTDYGYNGRVTYEVNSNWRASADASFWNESYSMHIDSVRRPPVGPPSPDYDLSQVNLKAKIVQLRAGADYLFLNKTTITPFVGLGLAYKIKTQNDFEYQFKSSNPNKPNIPIAIHNDDDKTTADNPYYLSMRAGAEGKIYRRLGWSANVTGQLRLNSRSNQTWGAQVGLVYSL